MEIQNPYMMKMEIFYQIIRKVSCIIIFMVFFSCKEKANSRKEVFNDNNTDEQEFVLKDRISEIYKKYADSINGIELTSSKLPNFITTYNSNLKSMERTAFHASKSDVYNQILDLCKVSQLKMLVNLLEQKNIKNENEKMVLEKAKYYINIKKEGG